jgi:hypothetical protein
MILVPFSVFLVYRCFAPVPLFNYAAERRAISIVLQFAAGLVLAVQSAHVLFLSVCCLRWVSGYDWWMVAHLLTITSYTVAFFLLSTVAPPDIPAGMSGALHPATGHKKRHNLALFPMD